MRQIESQTKIIQFVFAEFTTLTGYLEESVKVVSKIHNENDRCRSDIFEYVLNLF